MVPCVQYLLLYGLKTLCGIEGMNALPALLFSDEAMMHLVGFNAHQVRHGVCQRGAAKRQRPRTAGPICPDTLANNMVKLNLRDLEAWFNGAIRALAQADIFGAKVTGIVDATDLETTAQYEGCGQVTRKRKITDKHGNVHEIEVTVYGWKLIVLIDARTKIPLAAKVVPIQEHEALCLRALVTQARTNLAGHARCTRWSLIEAFWMAQICGGSTSMGSPLSSRPKRHGRDGGRPGASGRWGRDHRRPPRAHGPPWAGPRGVDRTAGDRGRGHHRADHL